MGKSSEMFKPVAQLLSHARKSQANEARKEAEKFSSLQPTETRDPLDTRSVRASHSTENAQFGAKEGS
jgi:antitoxin (DNA-binding transcriptional repressor) of toxin-antitoxin stability system